MKKYYLMITICITGISISGCKKFLDEKPDTHLEVPATLADFQAMLDRYPVFSTADPSSGEVSADNYYLNTADYLAMVEDIYRNMYTWQKTNLFDNEINDWFGVYQPVFFSNTILEGLNNIQVNALNQDSYNNIKGQALFARGKAFYLAASLWAQAYDKTTASQQLGIPIKMSADFNEKSTRSTLEETYSQIITDLTRAAALLPVTPVHVLRSSKPAAYAFIAKTYLVMRQYDKAGLYADSCLQLYNKLLDYNSLSTTATYPIARFNMEVIQDAVISGQQPVGNTRARIDSNLYLSYAVNDLRKTLFFKTSTNGPYLFKGSYEGSANLFGGIGTDEVYLMRAECYARAGNTVAAMNDLNTLLIKRFKTGTFANLTASSSSDALTMILTERRKELLMRSIRWMDLKRFNKEGANIILTRIVNGQTYILQPNDLRYALPIPDDIIQITGMQQNPR
jgi:tetratricopeptide (TPR) repeat protein